LLWVFLWRSSLWKIYGAISKKKITHSCSVLDLCFVGIQSTLKQRSYKGSVFETQTDNFFLSDLSIEISLKYPSWSMARFVLRIWQGHTCWVWKGFNTGHWGLHWVWWDLHRIIAWVFLVPERIWGEVDVDSVSRGTSGKLTGWWTGTTGGIGRFHLRQTIISEQFPEFGETSIDESMAGKIGLFGYW
jgi:hypothetical protein